jgi:hypothetical protein
MNVSAHGTFTAAAMRMKSKSSRPAIAVARRGTMPDLILDERDARLISAV